MKTASWSGQWALEEGSQCFPCIAFLFHNLVKGTPVISVPAVVSS